jgi:hypothetical protein
VLRYRHHEAEGVGLLERIVAYHGCRDLPSEDEHRRRIDVGGGDACHKVGHTWTGGGGAYSDLPGRASVPVGHVRGALLVPDQHMAYLRVQEIVVQRYRRTPWQPEHHIDALSLQQCKCSFGTIQKTVPLITTMIEDTQDLDASN